MPLAAVNPWTNLKMFNHSKFGAAAVAKPEIAKIDMETIITHLRPNLSARGSYRSCQISAPRFQRCQRDLNVACTYLK
jgi:hypothetical protein